MRNRRMSIERASQFLIDLQRKLYSIKLLCVLCCTSWGLSLTTDIRSSLFRMTSDRPRTAQRPHWSNLPYIVWLLRGPSFEQYYNTVCCNFTKFGFEIKMVTFINQHSFSAIEKWLVLVQSALQAIRRMGWAHWAGYHSMKIKHALREEREW